MKIHEKKLLVFLELFDLNFFNFFASSLSQTRKCLKKSDCMVDFWLIILHTKHTWCLAKVQSIVIMCLYVLYWWKRGKLNNKNYCWNKIGATKTKIIKLKNSSVINQITMPFNQAIGVFHCLIFLSLFYFLFVFMLIYVRVVIFGIFY